MIVSLVVNGEARGAECPAATLLVHFIREELGLTGTHVGCDTSSCSACAVIVDGVAVKSCTMLAAQAHDRTVETVEGLADGYRLGPLQEAFADAHALQCGFCTPGFLMTATAFLRANDAPREADVREAISGNLCRCTGYQHIVDAILAASSVTQ